MIRVRVRRVGKQHSWSIVCSTHDLLITLSWLRFPTHNRPAYVILTPCLFLGAIRKIKIEGIARSVEHSGEVGDRKVGPIQIVDSTIVKDAKESVIDCESLWNKGVTGLVVTPDSQVMLFEKNQLELV